MSKPDWVGPTLEIAISVAGALPGAVIESQPQESPANAETVVVAGAFLLQQFSASAFRCGVPWELQQQLSARLAGKASSSTAARIAKRAVEVNRGVMKRTYRPPWFDVNRS